MFKLADGTKSTDYKVGDKFVVVETSEFFNVGQVITLSEDDTTDCPWFNGEEPCCWHKLKAYKLQFAKSDLKDGMVVTYGNSCRRFIISGGLYGETDTGMFRGGRLDSYTEDLCYFDSDYCDLDIVKVEYMGELLWERTEEAPEQKEIKRLQGIIEDA